MIKLVILALFATFLIAGNPNVYSALGDVIYNNVDNIEKLKNISQFSNYKKTIDSYVTEVHKTKKIGYAIEAGNRTIDKKLYLQSIRNLSKTNDFFHRTTVKLYKQAIVDQNNELFSKTINSGLIDVKKYKPEILDYYFEYCSDINATGLIKIYLDGDKKLLKKKEISKKSKFTKKQIQEAKIKRIRKNDKEKQESIQKTLEDELIKKKSKIRKEQVNELAKPN